MVFTVAQIQAQNQQFEQARASGQITQAQYNTAMVVQNRSMAAAQANESFSPLPPQPGTPQYLQQGRQIERVEIAHTNPNTPLLKTKTIYLRPLQQTTPTGLELAKQEQLANERSQINPRTGGTYNPLQNQLVSTGETKDSVLGKVPVTVNPTQEAITRNLPLADKKAFSEWKQERVQGSMTSLGTTLIAASVAPVLGPVGAIKAVAFGLGATQAVKTGETAWNKGDISKSLLTPQEALFAAETGVIFGGISKGVFSGIKAVGGSKIVEGYGSGLTKSATSYLGTTGIAGGLGFGGGYVLSGGNINEGAKGAAYAMLFNLGMKAVVPRTTEFFRGKVSEGLTKSYESKALSNQEYFESTNADMGIKLKEYTLQYGEPQPGVWQPNTVQRFLMKTGSLPQRPASGIVSFGGPSEMINPTTGKSQYVKGLTINQMEAVSGSFDMGVAPNTSGLIVVKQHMPPKVTGNANLPLFFGVGENLLSYQEIKASEKAYDIPLEKGIPENMLAVDYKGALSFNNAPASFEYAKGKVQRFAWTDPYQQQPTQNMGMKPIWESKGSKVPTDITASKPISQVTIEQQLKNISGLGTPSTPISMYQENPFQTNRVRPYYAQRNIMEDTEEQFLAMPGKMERLTVPNLTHMPLLNMEASAFDTKQTNMQFNVPMLAPMLDTTQIQKQQPTQIQEQKATQIQDLIPRTATQEIYRSKNIIPNMNFPSGNSPGTGAFDRTSFPRLRGYKKHLWEFPVVGPKAFLRDWFSTSTKRKRRK